MPDSSTLRLVDPASGVALISLTGYSDTVGRLTKLDLGFPAVRAVTVPISGADGENDTTRWMGARPITAEVVIPAGSAADSAVDVLAGLLAPAGRYWLYAQRPGWPAERRITVRGATFTCPPGVLRTAQAGWVAPGGLFEDANPQTVVLSPSGATTGGRSYPRTFPFGYQPGLAPGAADITVGGTAPALPIVDMYGPCSNPALIVVSTGVRVAFTGLTLAAGDFLRVDLGARTAFLNADPSQSRYSLFDFTVSTWWQLPVGAVQVTFSPSTPSAGCHAVISYRNRWL